MRTAFLVMLLAASPAICAQAIDVGLVNLVSGEVTYAAAPGSSAKVQAFMKVRAGDRFTLPPGAELRLVFFDGGRQERWRGPASFRAAKGSSEPIDGKPVEVATLPAGTPQRIARVPDLLQYARLGGIQVRGLTRKQKASLEQQEAVRTARDTYAQMRKDMPADDITPELYLYATLYEFLLFDDMKPVVAEMRRKQPDNQDLKALEEWVSTRASR